MRAENCRQELVIEQEFLGVDQGPNDIFVGPLGVLLILLDVSQGNGGLFRRWLTREREQVQFTQLGAMFASFIRTE